MAASVDEAVLAVATPAAQRYGSFQDSLKAPIHRWFTYPAGYSYKLVEAKIAQAGLAPDAWVADPFLGSGTTSLAAKLLGFNSVGIEAHPFVFWVAQTKLNFELDAFALEDDLRRVIETARLAAPVDLAGLWPALIYKCFDADNLQKLYALRQAIGELDCPPAHTDFLKLALTNTLRIVTTAGAGWPYIAPSKYAERVVRRDAFSEFRKQCEAFAADLRQVQFHEIPRSEHRLIQGDAREFARHCPPASIDLILTSPPYLNNYDYADRTRLETYFWGLYRTWGDITRQVRDHLITAATTQIRLSEMAEVAECPGIQPVNPAVHRELRDIVRKLSIARKAKAGKKTYDIMVAAYFEDMLKVIQGAYAVLKPGRQFVLVLGDSAPYGVHVRTEEIIGQLAVSVGFSGYSLEALRERGGKWANNPQRHKVPLRESILTIIK